MFTIFLFQTNNLPAKRQPFKDILISVSEGGEPDIKSSNDFMIKGKIQK